jgi:hypothetical protein
MGANKMTEVDSTLTFPIESPFEGGASALIADWTPAFGTCHKQHEVNPLAIQETRETLVGDINRDRAFRLSISRIQDYCNLPEDWDTYGGLPASPEAARFSIDLLNTLRAKPEISAPDVQPISTGVYLEWHSGETTLYFEVDEDSVLFVVRKGDDVVVCGEDPDFQVGRAIELVRRFHQDDIGTDD